MTHPQTGAETGKLTAERGRETTTKIEDPDACRGTRKMERKTEGCNREIAQRIPALSWLIFGVRRLDAAFESTVETTPPAKPYPSLSVGPLS